MLLAGIDFMLPIVALGFVFQFVDSSVGMGYGSLTPVLLLLGYHPLVVVPAILATSAALSLFTGGLYQAFRNIDIMHGRTRRIIALLLGFGLAGMLLGVFIADHLPEQVLTLYIGLLTVTVGLLVLFLRRRQPSVSWPRLAGFGAVASFNKGMTGGGFGPVLAGGQIISGVEGRQAVGVTALVEGVLSTVGVAAYLLIDPALTFDTGLVASLLVGGIVASPLAAYAVSQVRSDQLRIAVAGASILIGLGVVIQAVL